VDQDQARQGLANSEDDTVVMQGGVHGVGEEVENVFHVPLSRASNSGPSLVWKSYQVLNEGRSMIAMVESWYADVFLW
jgi:hypothetical protein